MDKSLEHYIFHKSNFLSHKFCEEALVELSDANWKKHNWDDVFDDDDIPTYRSGDNEPRVFYSSIEDGREQLNRDIVKKIHPVLSEYIDYLACEWFQAWSGYTSIKFIEYSHNQTMAYHCDHIRSMFDGKKKGIPILSIIGTLNDNYEGGELMMFDDQEMVMNQGDLIIFPSVFLYPHKINPIKKGKRYSYISWVW